MIKKSMHNRGFTILETIVAVLILSISVASMVVIVGGGSQKTIQNKDRLIAAYLAQEGIELTRNVRDTLFLVYEDEVGTSARWSAFKDQFDTCIGGLCAIAYDFGVDGGEIPVIISGGYDIPLNYDANTGYYGYESGDETMFVRTVHMTEVDTDAIRVEVYVEYREGSEPRTYTTSEVLFNWF